MKQILFLLLIIPFFYCCKMVHRSEANSISESEMLNSQAEESIDELIWDYIEANQNRFGEIKKNKISYMERGMSIKNDKEYLTILIGNHWEDHFATLQWIYIDTAQFYIYEFDSERNTMQKWEGLHN